MHKQPGKFVLLSYSIEESMPLYGATPHPKVEKFSSIEEGDTANTSIITMHNHTGTHIDFPNHFFEEGMNSSGYTIDDFIFNNPIVVDIPCSPDDLIFPEQLNPFIHELNEADILLIKTGFGKKRETGIYSTHNPGIHSDAIRYLRSDFKNIRAIGIDSISISSYQHREEGRKAHKEALCINDNYGKPIMLIEDMDLDYTDEFKRVLALPINIRDLDGLPCTVIGEL